MCVFLVAFRLCVRLLVVVLLSSISCYGRKNRINAPAVHIYFANGVS
jgi:hypothetical protein